MANVLSVKIEDEEGGTKTIPYYFPVGTTHTDVSAWFLLAQVALDALIGGKIVEAVYSEAVFVNPALVKANPVAGSRADAGATLSFKNSAGVAVSQYIPTMKNSKLVNGIVVIDDGQVEAYTDLVISGAATDENELNIVSVTGGKQSRRK